MSLQISKRPVLQCCFSGTLSGCLTTSFRGRTVFNGPLLNRSTKMQSGMTAFSQPPQNPCCLSLRDHETLGSLRHIILRPRAFTCKPASPNCCVHLSKTESLHDPKVEQTLPKPYSPPGFGYFIYWGNIRIMERKWKLL